MSANRRQIEKRLRAARQQLELALTEVMNSAADADSEGDMPRADEYLRMPQLCARIGIPEQTIRNKMSCGELKRGVHFFKRGRTVVFHWTAMEKWVRGEEVENETVEPFIPVHHARSRKAS